MHAIARYIATRTSDIPQGMADMFVLHLEHLRASRNKALKGLALTTLALLCSSATGAALAQQHASFQKHISTLLRAFVETHTQQLEGGMMLLGALLRHATESGGGCVGAGAAGAGEEEEVGLRMPAWLRSVVQRVRVRLVRVIRAPFASERALALSLLKTLVTSRGAGGVRCLFEGGDGRDVAAAILAAPWAPDASVASTVGRFVGADEATACELKYAIAKAAAGHPHALTAALGEEQAECILDLAARGPMTQATASHVPKARARRTPARPRSQAVPLVATMYATK